MGFLERFCSSAFRRKLPLGVIKFIECSRLTKSRGRENDLGVVEDLMVHDLDLALSVVGEEPVSVSAIGSPILNQLNDIANARLEFPSGVVVNLNACRVSSEASRKMQWFRLRDLPLSIF